MVITKKITPVLRGRKAALLAFAPAFFTASTSAYVPMEAGLVMPVFAVLITMVIGSLLILRQQAEAARPAAPLVPRPSRRAGEGPAGLLRELAKSAGAPESGAQAVQALDRLGDRSDAALAGHSLNLHEQVLARLFHRYALSKLTDRY